MEFRGGVSAEALAERTRIVNYFGGMLMFDQASHPRTFDLAQIATTVGQFIAMHYKRENNRPRPSQLSPLLMPPIAVPGHASFPSAHGTEAYLMAGLLARVMPAAATAALQPAANSGNPDAASLLERLAERIARNREVLGLHYRSDTLAGQFLAEPDAGVAEAVSDRHEPSSGRRSGRSHRVELASPFEIALALNRA